MREQDIPLIPVLKNRPQAVIYGPLSEVPLPPDVVLLFVNADQTLILSEASQQLEGGLPPAMGRPACAVVPQALNNNQTALSLGCCGARAYLDILTPGVAVYAIPGKKLESVHRACGRAGQGECGADGVPHTCAGKTWKRASIRAFRNRWRR